VAVELRVHTLQQSAKDSELGDDRPRIHVASAGETGMMSNNF
jgi:hypothetical protein